MIRGFYTALSGIIASMNRQAIVADNIANVNTPGFKGSRSTQSDFGLTLASSLGGPLGQLGTATLASGLTLDRLQGPLESTALPTDMAIEGDGLFVIRTAGGALAYTRAGNFVVDMAGTLTTQLGEPVLDVAGRPIVVPGGAANLVLDPNGNVAGTGQRIALVALPAAGMSRRGDNTYAISGPTSPAVGRVRQGVLERSNVDLATSMTELITIQRAFALSSRALSIQEQTIGDANDVGRVR
jgi:flagellar basal body rod protein FlgG